MSKSIKSLFAGVLMASMVLTLAPAPAAAQTSQDQINSLLAMIAQLQAQIAALQGGTVGTGTGTTLTCNFTANLTVGSTGNQVRALQQFLNAKGFTVAASGAGSVGNETTYFGPATRAAVARFQVANGISPTAGYFGPLTRAKVNAMCTVVVPPGGGTTPPPAGSNLTVSLASDNPAAMAIPRGAAGVTFLKVNVMGTGTIDSLTFKRVGAGLVSDFASAGIYLYDGNTRLTSGRSLNSTTHEVTFVGLNLPVSGTKSLSLVADVSSSATVGDRNAFQLVAATGTPSVTLTILTGNEMTIAGATVGSVTVDDGAAPTNPRVGQQGAKLAEIKLTAGSTEDIDVRRLALTEGGSIANSNITNLVLKQAGNTVATASSIGSRDLVVFTFTTPFMLEKGQERTFEVFGDISGATRSSDTIVFYVDSKSDVQAIGRTYGFSVDPTITDIDTTAEADTLTVQGGDVTVTFNGPIASDIALRGQDVMVYDFTIAAQNAVEIRNLRFHATTTGLISGQGFNDMKVWDVATNSVLTSPTDVTTSTDVTYTDTINIAAGQSRRFKVTVDVDPDNDANDTLQVSLLAFQSNDIRNLDNNTFVSTGSIVPNSTISGNTMTVKAPALDVQLAATPSSQTYAKGTVDAALAGFSFRAVSDNVRLDSVKVTASATSGTLTSGEVTSLALYDGTTRVSSIKSLDSSALTVTFDSLNLTIANGTTKTLTLRGNISSDATNGDVYAFKIADLTNDVVSYDTQSNSLTETGVNANSGATVTISIVSSGDVTVVTAASDSESEAGIVVAGREEVLAKFRVTAASEAMTLNKLQILVNTAGNATATSTTVADEVPVVKLYKGATQIGASGGYAVNASGDNAGIAVIENLNFMVAKDSSETITVKGVLNTISGGADSGTSVYVSIMAANFEAQGSSAKDTTITAATGNEKVVYKTKPTITTAAGDATLTNGLRKVMTFTVAADSAEQVAWKKVQLFVTMTGATMSATTGGTTGTVQIKDVSAGSNLNIATVYSAAATTGTTTSTITGGSSGYVSMFLNTEQVIAAGSSKTYEVYLTFADVPSGSASAVVQLARVESSVVGGTTFDAVEGTYNGTPSFIWSDYSTVGHSESTSADWANGMYVKTLPSTSYTISKT